MKSARSDVRQSLLRYLQPWLHNMELVEPAIPSPNVIAPLSSLELDVSSDNLRQSVSSSSSCSLCGKRNVDEGERVVRLRRGWGSTEATEMVLNNLLYLTAKVILRDCKYLFTTKYSRVYKIDPICIAIVVWRRT
jgi:hypothetical protein